MTERPFAEIAGAGLAGLAMAAALAQRGWRVRVHEKSKDLREIGAGIYLWRRLKPVQYRAAFLFYEPVRCI